MVRVRVDNAAGVGHVAGDAGKSTAAHVVVAAVERVGRDPRSEAAQGQALAGEGLLQVVEVLFTLNHVGQVLYVPVVLYVHAEQALQVLILGCVSVHGAVHIVRAAVRMDRGITVQHPRVECPGLGELGRGSLYRDADCPVSLGNSLQVPEALADVGLVGKGRLTMDVEVVLKVHEAHLDALPVLHAAPDEN